MTVQVGQGIWDKMEANGDHPLKDSEFIQNSDGSTYEKCVGTKGVYVSSNASGDWEVVFYEGFLEV